MRTPASLCLAIALLAVRSPRATADEPRPVPSSLVEIATIEHHRGPVSGLDPFLASDSHPAARRRAIVALGRIGSDDEAVVPRLVRFLRSGSPDLDLALWAAGISGHKILVPAALSHLGAKEERTLLAALEALGMLGDPGAARRIAPLLTHEFPAVRTAAAYALSRAGSGEVLEAIVARVAETDADARRAVAAAAWRCAGAAKKARTTTTVTWSDPAAAAALAPLARDPDPETRIFALRALNILWPKTLAAAAAPDLASPAAVAAAAVADPDARVVADFVFRIVAGQHDGPVVLQTIAAALENPDALVRETAAEAAVKVGSPEVVAILKERLSREVDARVRERLAIALAACGDDDAAAKVLARDDRPKDADRRAVTEAQVLLASKKPESHARAVAMLKDPKTPVLALEALLDGFAEVDHPDLADALLPLIQNGDSVVAGAAADLAAKKKLVALLEPIIEAYASAVEAVWPQHNSRTARDRGRDARQGFVEAVLKLEKTAEWKDPTMARARFRAWLDHEPSSVVLNAAREAMKKDEKSSMSSFPNRPFPPEWSGLPRPKAPILGLDLTQGKGPLSEEEILRLAQRIADVKPLLVVETEGLGVTKFRLDAEEAPLHAASVVIAATMGVYDGTPWHRVVPAFVIQGADPRGDGSGDAGWLLPDEITRGPFRRGALGMPKGVKDTGGCQLFVMHCYAPHLDGRYTAYGEAVEGMDVVDRIRVGDRIKSARIVVP